MRGWIVPQPEEPTKSPEQLRREREEKVSGLAREGLLRSEWIRQAMLTVRREDFVPRLYRDHAYREVPLPLPGRHATISCPHSYPLFYEPLGLHPGDRFLEVGVGSGYGTALAREIVGDEGLVVSVEIDPETFDFARANLERAGYRLGRSQTPREFVDSLLAGLSAPPAQDDSEPEEGEEPPEAPLAEPLSEEERARRIQRAEALRDAVLVYTSLRWSGRITPDRRAELRGHLARAR